MEWDRRPPMTDTVVDEDPTTGLLPRLRALQRDNGGRIPDAALAALAAAEGVTPFEARALAIFAESFTPDGRPHVLGVCRGNRCARRGGREIGDWIADRLGLAWWAKTADGRVELEPVYCLGLCDHGPSARVDDELIARLDRAGPAALLAELTGDGHSGE
jgi:formate dehydrogenase subunit gamma